MNDASHGSRRFLVVALLVLLLLAGWTSWKALQPLEAVQPSPVATPAATPKDGPEDDPVEAPPTSDAPSAQAPASRTQAGSVLELTTTARRTVVWISIDGVRSDYLSRAEFPTLHRLEKEGAFSRALVPIFPSLTFPSHIAHATGTPVSVHGIPGNTFYDRRAKRHYAYPSYGTLLGAEPIWHTAPRQGVRTAVLDWPLSHGQIGRVRAQYFGERFNSRLSDVERLELLLAAWEKDEDTEQPLRLLMGYMQGPDETGHKHGPDSELIVPKLQEVDRGLAAFLPKALALWERTRKPGDEFYLLLTTDHGMAAVDWLVNLDRLAGIEGEAGITTSNSGNVAHLFFEDAQVAERNPALLDAIVERVRKQEFALAYRRDQLPEDWKLAHPQRTGDIVVVLKQGYTFGRRFPDLLAAAAERGGPLGMHGYDPQVSPDMHGFMILWRAESPLGGKDLGQVHSLQLHPSVAKLLGIESSPQAQGKAFVQVP